MEVRRAMFLRAWNHNLETIAYPLGFRAALGGLSCFSKWRAVKLIISNSPKNRGETGIFTEDKLEIKDKGQQN